MRAYNRGDLFFKLITAHIGFSQISASISFAFAFSCPGLFTAKIYYIIRNGYFIIMAVNIK